MLNLLHEKKPHQKYISFLTAVNVIIIMLSLCIAAFGVLLQVNGQVLKPTFDDFIHQIAKLFITAGLDVVHFSSFDPVKILKKLSLPVMILGAYFLFLAVFGMISAKKKAVMLLIVYICFKTLGFLLLASLLYVVFGYRKLIDERLKPYILTGVQENYRGFNGTDLFSQSLNIVMMKFQCCGVNDYTDFKDASHWIRTLFQDGWWFDLRTPLTCCNMKKKEINDFACAVNPTDSNSYYLQGCYEAFWRTVYAHKGFPLAVVSFLMFVKLTLIIAGMLLVHEIRNKRKKETEEENKTEVRTNGENGLANSMRSGQLNNLPFTGLSVGMNKETFQQNQNDDRRFSVRPDLLAAFLLGSRRFSQTPCYDYGLPQDRMPSFDFGIHNDRMQSFDFGIPHGQMPSFDFCRSQYNNGVPQGPIIVNLPHQSSAQPALKAITHFTETPTTVSESTIDVVKQNNADSNLSGRKFERCKSENCINRKQQTFENVKPTLKRQSTCPNGIQTTVIREEEQ